VNDLLSLNPKVGDECVWMDRYVHTISKIGEVVEGYVSYYSSKCEDKITGDVELRESPLCSLPLLWSYRK